jgi:thiosulfate dehydrogenase
MTTRALFFMLVLALGGCSSKAEHISASERGQELFESRDNVAFACTTCHPGTKPDDSRIFPGSDLHGVTQRTSFWGGQEDDLLRAVNDCHLLFQNAETAFSADDADAADLYAFLTSLAGPSDAVPFTIVRSVSDLPAGDETKGAQIYDQACHTCHGDLHTGAGALSDLPPKLPDFVLLEHAAYPKDQQRVIFVEKVRHGGFLGYTGSMPPFSTEVLSDDQVSDLLSYLGLYSP